LKETRPLWPPQRGVGLQEPNLGKTNPRVTFLFACDLFCALSRGLVSLLITLTRLVVVIIFVNFSFALFTPPSRRLSTTTSKHQNSHIISYNYKKIFRSMTKPQPRCLRLILHLHNHTKFWSHSSPSPFMLVGSLCTYSPYNF
jgi:hypothetical protein